MSQINWFTTCLLISKAKRSRQTWISMVLVVLRIPILERKRGARRRGECHLSYRHCNWSNEYFQYFNWNSLRASWYYEKQCVQLGTWVLSWPSNLTGWIKPHKFECNRLWEVWPVSTFPGSIPFSEKSTQINYLKEDTFLKCFTIVPNHSLSISIFMLKPQPTSRVNTFHN